MRSNRSESLGSRQAWNIQERVRGEGGVLGSLWSQRACSGLAKAARTSRRISRAQEESYVKDQHVVSRSNMIVSL